MNRRTIKIPCPRCRPADFRALRKTGGGSCELCGGGGYIVASIRMVTPGRMLLDIGRMGRA